MNHLNKYQKKVLEEALQLGSGSLSLPMGYGKTLLSLCLAIKQAGPDEKIIVVCSKTLVSSWIHEVEKFFGDEMKHLVYLTTNKETEIPTDVKLVITTPETCSKYYKQDFIAGSFITNLVVNEGRFGQHSITFYERPDKPFGQFNFLYATRFGVLIIDEAQTYTKISSLRAKALASLCATRRWLTSGTIFNEPTLERVLGYHLLINHPGFPRCLPQAGTSLSASNYKGIKGTMIIRKKNQAFIEPCVNEVIIECPLDRNESKIYKGMKTIIDNVRKEIERLKAAKDIEGVRTFNSYMLALIIYLRQTLVCPVLPIATVAVDIADASSNNLLSIFINKEMNKMELDSYLSSKDSVKSTRINQVIKTIQSHKNETVLVFSCFRTTLSILEYYLGSEGSKDPRRLFSINGSMSINARNKMISDFTGSKDGVLLLTYALGAEGLNLQACHNVLLIDLEWNFNKGKQAIARVNRLGQESKHVNVYYYVSNTAIENEILKLHRAKIECIDTLINGGKCNFSRGMNTARIAEIICTDENQDALRGLIQT